MTRRFLWLSVARLGLLGVAGCSAVLGLDEFQDDGASGSGAQAGSGNSGANGGAGAGASGGFGAGGVGNGGGGATGGGGDGGGGGANCGDGTHVPGELCFSPAVHLDTTAIQASALVLLDCDDDGDLDIIAAHESTPQLTAFRNGGSGVFNEVALSDTFVNLWGLEIVDATDGAQVLVGIGFPQRFVRMVRNAPACEFQQDATANLLLSDLRDVAVFEGNNNMTADVIITGNPSPPDAVLYMHDFASGFPSFSDANSAATQPHAIGVGNIIGAGDAIAITDVATRKVEVREYVSAGGLLYPETGQVGENPIGIAVGDINGDFRDDVITANQGDSTISVLTNDGQGGLVKPGADLDVTGGSAAVGSPRDLALADLDGDGDLDAVVASSFDGTGTSYVTIMLNAGGGAFSLATDAGALPLPAEVGRQPWAVRAGDLNGDGIPDIVTANHFDDGLTSTVSVILSNP